MHWFKHDSDASQDAKLKRLRMKYGLEGYGLYWYCVELIASEVDQNKFTFELEHDSEIIAFDTGIHVERVNEMMAHMVNLGLFESNNNTITCLKMLKRLDQSMTSNKKMRELINKAKENHDGVMISHDSVMQEEIRIDKIRNKDMSTEVESHDDFTTVLAHKVIETYNTVKTTQKPNWTAVEAITKTRLSTTKKRVLDVQKRIGSKDNSATLHWFNKFLISLSTEPFYSGRPSASKPEGYKWNFDSLFREKNFIAAIERLNDE